MKSSIENAKVLAAISILSLVVFIPLWLFDDGEGGANIGAGLVLMVFIASSIGALMLYALGSSGLKRISALLAALVLIVGFNMVWSTGEEESNRLYCEEKIASGAPIFEGEAFCDPYR